MARLMIVGAWVLSGVHVIIRSLAVMLQQHGHSILEGDNIKGLVSYGY